MKLKANAVPSQPGWKWNGIPDEMLWKAINSESTYLVGRISACGPDGLCFSDDLCPGGQFDRFVRTSIYGPAVEMISIANELMRRHPEIPEGAAAIWLTLIYG